MMPNPKPEEDILFTPDELEYIRDRALQNAEWLRGGEFFWWFDKLVEMAQRADELSKLYAQFVNEFEDAEVKKSLRNWAKNLKGVNTNPEDDSI